MQVCVIWTVICCNPLRAEVMIIYWKHLWTFLVMLYIHVHVHVVLVSRFYMYVINRSMVGVCDWTARKWRALIMLFLSWSTCNYTTWSQCSQRSSNLYLQADLHKPVHVLVHVNVHVCSRFLLILYSILHVHV